LRLPPDETSGRHRLQVEAAGQVAVLADLNLAASTRRFDVPPVSTSVNAILGDQVRLIGADLVPSAGLRPPGSPLPLTVTLTWQALTTPQTNYTVFVHLLDPNGRIVAQSDTPPAGGYATSRWLPGEVVVDSHALAVPEGNPSRGRFRLLVGMYDPISGRRLPAVAATGVPIPENAVPLGEVAFP
ncbi:MAG TPA: hypothetical protein DEP84_13930, partial [Chloroflexi bacterium]|nr:hypothetical protein [Chloroflexota bacterium]